MPGSPEYINKVMQDLPVLKKARRTLMGLASRAVDEDTGPSAMFHSSTVPLAHHSTKYATAADKVVEWLYGPVATTAKFVFSQSGGAGVQQVGIDWGELADTLNKDQRDVVFSKSLFVGEVTAEHVAKLGHSIVSGCVPITGHH